MGVERMSVQDKKFLKDHYEFIALEFERIDGIYL